MIRQSLVVERYGIRDGQGLLSCYRGGEVLDNHVTLLSAKDGEKQGEDSDMLRGVWTVVAVSFIVLLFSMPASAAESKGKPAGKDESKSVTAATACEGLTP